MAAIAGKAFAPPRSGSGGGHRALPPREQRVSDDEQREDAVPCHPQPGDGLLAADGAARLDQAGGREAVGSHQDGREQVAARQREEGALAELAVLRVQQERGDEVEHDDRAVVGERERRSGERRAIGERRGDRERGEQNSGGAERTPVIEGIGRRRAEVARRFAFAGRERLAAHCQPEIRRFYSVVQSRLAVKASLAVRMTDITACTDCAAPHATCI